MRSTPSNRLLRAFVALWFLAFGGELVGVHACPMHDGVAAPAHGSTAAHGGHDHHASGPSAAATASATTHEGSDAGHCCTCVGMGCGASPVASIATGPVALAAIVTRGASTGVEEVAEVRTGRAVHVLPFANGPPARALTA